MASANSIGRSITSNRQSQGGVMESESMIVILVTLFVFMLGFSVARLSSDKMTVKECFQSTVLIENLENNKTKGQ